MTAQTWTLSSVGGFTDLLHDANLRSVRAYVVSSEEVVTDTTTGGAVHLGAKSINAAIDEPWSVAGLPATGDPNWMPEIAAYKVIVDYLDDSPDTGVLRWESNYFTLTANVDFKDVVAVTPTAVTPAMVANFNAAIAAITGKAAQMTLRAVATSTTAADAEFIEVDATSAVRTVTGPAAGAATRWGVKKVNGTSTAPGNKVTISYLNSAGATTTLDLTLAGESKVFRPSGSGYRVESGDTPKAGLDNVYGALPATRNTATVVVQDEAPPTPQRHGAKGDSTTDDTAAVQAWLDAGYSQGFVPRGVYRLNGASGVGVTQKNGMAVRFDENATVKAGATLTTLWDTPSATQVRDCSLLGGIFDCNDLAATGIQLRYFAEFPLCDNRVYNATGDAVVVGATGTANVSYGAFVRGLKIDRPNHTAKTTGARGVFFQNANDCKVIHSEIVGADIGIQAAGGGHQFILVNSWGYSNSLPTTCFDIYNSSEFVACTADTPTTYGFRLRSGSDNSRIIGGKTYVNTVLGVDNTVIGVQLDAAAYLTVLGHFFQGGNGTHRIAKDFGGTLTNIEFDQCEYSNVAITTQARNRGFTGLTSWGGSPGSMNQRFNVATNATGDVNFLNGADGVWYSGNYSGEKARIDGATGIMQSGHAVTGSRPPATSWQAGMYYDNTLSKPIWSDGTNWRDASGTIV